MTKIETKMKTFTTVALLTAMSTALGFVVLFRMPQGGSVTAFSMLPIIICGYLFGTRYGVLAGVCVGMLNLILNPFVVHPAQLLLDYPLAFGALGLGALVRNMPYGLYLGYGIGIFGRFFCAMLSGYIFFGSYAPEGYSALTWAIIYNASYIGAEAVITIIVLLIPSVRDFFTKKIKTMI